MIVPDMAFVSENTLPEVIESMLTNHHAILGAIYM